MGKNYVSCMVTMVTRRIHFKIDPIPDIVVPVPVAQSVECPLRMTRGHGLDPMPRNTKVVKNGTSCSSLGTQIDGVMLSESELLLVIRPNGDHSLGSVIK